MRQRGLVHARLGDLLLESGDVDGARVEWEYAIGLERDRQATDRSPHQSSEVFIQGLRRKIEELAGPEP